MLRHQKFQEGGKITFSLTKICAFLETENCHMMLTLLHQ